MSGSLKAQFREHDHRVRKVGAAEVGGNSSQLSLDVLDPEAGVCPGGTLSSPTRGSMLVYIPKASSVH